MVHFRQLRKIAAVFLPTAAKSATSHSSVSHVEPQSDRGEKLVAAQTVAAQSPCPSPTALRIQPPHTEVSFGDAVLRLQNHIIRAMNDNPAKLQELKEQALKQFAEAHSHVVLDTQWLFPDEMCGSLRRAIAQEHGDNFPIDRKKYENDKQRLVECFKPWSNWLAGIQRDVVAADLKSQTLASEYVSEFMIRGSTDERTLESARWHSDNTYLNCTVVLVGESTFYVPNARRQADSEPYTIVPWAIQSAGRGETLVFACDHRTESVSMPVLPHREPFTTAPRLLILQHIYHPSKR